MSDAVNTNKHAVSSLYLPSPPPSLSLSLSLSLLVAQGARTTTGQSHRLIRAALEARRADALGRAPSCAESAEPPLQVWLAKLQLRKKWLAKLLFSLSGMEEKAWFLCTVTGALETKKVRPVCVRACVCGCVRVCVCACVGQQRRRMMRITHERK